MAWTFKSLPDEYSAELTMEGNVFKFSTSLPEPTRHQMVTALDFLIARFVMGAEPLNEKESP